MGTRKRSRNRRFKRGGGITLTQYKRTQQRKSYTNYLKRKFRFGTLKNRSAFNAAFRSDLAKDKTLDKDFWTKHSETYEHEAEKCYTNRVFPWDCLQESKYNTQNSPEIVKESINVDSKVGTDNPMNTSESDEGRIPPVVAGKVKSTSESDEGRIPPVVAGKVKSNYMDLSDFAVGALFQSSNNVLNRVIHRVPKMFEITFLDQFIDTPDGTLGAGKIQLVESDGSRTREQNGVFQLLQLDGGIMSMFYYDLKRSAEIITDPQMFIEGRDVYRGRGYKGLNVFYPVFVDTKVPDTYYVQQKAVHGKKRFLRANETENKFLFGGFTHDDDNYKLETDAATFQMRPFRF